ncbi:MAG: hypothetical protein HY675_00910 [Chloroflexi bacterium]|nr:hypothetical protein [Chloroflexota bacterium]
MTNSTGEVSPVVEEKVLRVYQDLKDILGRDDLPPSVRANAVQALACVWQIVNDLTLEYEMLYDLGV